MTDKEMLEGIKRRISDQLNEYLRDHDMTAQAFSKKAGIHPNSLSSYLYMATAPKLDNLCRIASALDMTVSELTDTTKENDDGRRQKDTNAR